MTFELQSSTQSNKTTLSTQSKKMTLPGPRGLPFIGYLPFMGKYPHKTFIELAKKYGDVFQLRLGSRPVVVINGLESLRQAALKQQNDFAGRASFYFFRRGGRGLTIGAANGELWKRQREITFNAMHKFLAHKKTFIEQQVMEEAAELSEVFRSYEGQPFDPERDIGMAVANVTTRIVYGRRYSRNEREFCHFIEIARDFVSRAPGTMVIDVLPKPPILSKILDRKSFENLEEVLNLLEKIALNHVKEHKDSYNPENIRDLIDALLEAVSELDESDKALNMEKRLLNATSMELMGTGLEPHFSILHWMLLYLITYPEIQTKLQQELDEVVGREGPVCFEDRKRLPFTEACIQETLRHCPPNPLALPHATTVDTTLNGYFIPQNTTVFLNLYSVSRDERYWKEPEQFNPHRFLNTNGHIKEDLLDKHYPFGIGKRRCFGEYLGRLELFVLLTNVLRKWRFEKVAGEKLDLQPNPGITLIPKNYKVKVTPRF